MRFNHLNYLGGPQSQPSTFFVLTNSVRYDLGRSVSEQVMFKAKGNRRFVSDRHMFLLELKTLRTLSRRSNHLKYLGGPKSYVLLTKIGYFGLETCMLCYRPRLVVQQR